MEEASLSPPWSSLPPSPQHQHRSLELTSSKELAFAPCLQDNRMFWQIENWCFYLLCSGRGMTYFLIKPFALFLRLMPHRLQWHSLVKDTAKALVLIRTNQISEFVLKWKDQVFHIWLRNAWEFYFVLSYKVVCY